jgi:hypothetical protein
LASAGECHIIGDKMKKKREINMGSSRVSITILRTGSAAGETGPTTFLPVGTRRKPGFTDEFLVRNGGQEGSPVAITDNGYMTRKVMLETAEVRAGGIRKMAVICEQPTWWVIEIWDNCSAHFCDPVVMEIYFRNYILMVNEEGDTSHCNKAYDQSVAREDKKCMREILGILRSTT